MNAAQRLADAYLAAKLSASDMDDVVDDPEERSRATTPWFEAGRELAIAMLEYVKDDPSAWVRARMALDGYAAGKRAERDA